MYATYYDELQPYFGKQNIQLQYMNCYSFVLSLKTENFVKDLKNIEDKLDFCNLGENQELFSNKDRKVIGKFEIETPKKICIDEFIAWRSKMYAFKCEDHSMKKLKGISRLYSKNSKFDDYRKNLDGEEYPQECDDHLIRSIILKCIFNE